MSGEFEARALALHQDGHRVVPLPHGRKGPTVKGWQGLADTQTEDLVRELVRTANGAGVGVLAKWTPAVDVDVREPELAQQLAGLAHELLGPTVERIGQAPKLLLPYRAEAPFPRITSRGFRLPGDGPGDKPHRVEVLADGQQWVAYHTHPDTGRPYAWPEGDLPARDDLPEITVERARLFIERAEAAIIDAGGVPVGSEHPTSSGGVGAASLHGQAGTLEAVADALRYVPNADASYDEWVKIGLAIKAALGEAGRDLWLDWSAKSAKHVQATSEQSWRSFKPTSIGAGSLYRRAQQNGWKPGSSLILNAATAEAVAKVDLSGLKQPLQQVGAAHTASLRPAAGHAPETSEWAEPIPLLAEHVAPLPYPVDALPPVLRAAVVTYQRYAQQPIALVACSALANASLACQALADVDRDDNLSGPSSLAFLTIAESGERKTACDKRLGRTARAWQLDRRRQMAPGIALARGRLEVWQARREGILVKIKRLSGSTKAEDEADRRALETDLGRLDGERPRVPPEPELFMEDVSPEALAVRLAEGWPSSSLWSDEGGLVVGSHAMGEESAMRFLALLNRLWDGNPFTRRRTTRESVTIEGRRFTGSLMVQPLVMAKLLATGEGSRVAPEHWRVSLCAGLRAQWGIGPTARVTLTPLSLPPSTRVYLRFCRPRCRSLTRKRWRWSHHGSHLRPRRSTFSGRSMTMSRPSLWPEASTPNCVISQRKRPSRRPASPAYSMYSSTGVRVRSGPKAWRPVRGSRRGISMRRGAFSAL